MSDIVERLRNCFEYHESALIDVTNEAADEIESLRQQLNDAFDEKQILSQRVKEVEEFNLIHKFEKKLLREKLAALKQSQGRSRLQFWESGMQAPYSERMQIQLEVDLRRALARIVNPVLMVPNAKVSGASDD